MSEPKELKYLDHTDKQYLLGMIAGLEKKLSDLEGLIGVERLENKSLSVAQKIESLGGNQDQIYRMIESETKERRSDFEKLSSRIDTTGFEQSKIKDTTVQTKQMVNDIDTMNDQLFLFLKGVFMGLGYETVAKSIQEIIDSAKGAKE